MEQVMNNGILSHLPADAILAAYMAAPGNEVTSGKFTNPESSAALAANTFGLFLGDRAGELPPLPGTEHLGWPATRLALEGIVRFPWSGGRHPCLDALIETNSAIIGVESKRFEPFRSKSAVKLSEAYWRPVWGDAMRGYESVRNLLRDHASPFQRLDAAQLVKHAFGLRTEAERYRYKGTPRSPILFYLYAEPWCWPSTGKIIGPEVHQAHRKEIDLFAQLVADDEVAFIACGYRQLLTAWRSSLSPAIRDHADVVTFNFKP